VQTAFQYQRSITAIQGLTLLLNVLILIQLLSIHRGFGKIGRCMGWGFYPIVHMMAKVIMLRQLTPLHHQVKFHLVRLISFFRQLVSLLCIFPLLIWSFSANCISVPEVNHGNSGFDSTAERSNSHPASVHSPGIRKNRKMSGMRFFSYRSHDGTSDNAETADTTPPSGKIPFGTLSRFFCQLVTLPCIFHFLF
jgi:hypothetical protein